MGTAVSKRRNLRNDAISSVAAKVRAARAFGEYLHAQPESRNGSDHLLSDTLIGHDSDSPDSVCTQNNNHQHSFSLQDSNSSTEPNLIDNTLHLLQPSAVQSTCSESRLSLERSFSVEEEQQKCVECSLQPSRVYTISGESAMLAGSRTSKESLELDVLREARDAPSASQTLAQASTSSSPIQHHHRHANHQSSTRPNLQQPAGGGQGSAGAGPSQHQHHHHHHHHHLSQPLQSSISAHNIRGWGEGKECGLACDLCPGAPSRSHGSLELESSVREPGKQRRPLERMSSVDRVTFIDREDNQWYPKENMFSFQTATTTMQAISNFRKHLRMVGSRRMKAQTFAERRAKSFNRSWSDPTPVKQDSLPDSKDSGDLQMPSAAPDEGGCNDTGWEEEKEMERLACESDDFIPPKVMLISSKVPKAEYVPNIIRRDDPSVIPILYDHEHATFDDILEEIEKRLASYRRGCKIWSMLIFCQGGPGHLYLLKNKVATFAKVEKEEDMSQFWKRLSKFMSKVNPEPNLIHVMGCYVLGNPNGEKLFQKLKNLMRPYSVTFESPLELSAQGKEMIETYFDFRLYRLWKTRQHSKLMDYEDLL
ncbi:NMDA receptor synaptonuclear signaling and neuronal migration factor isoform X1 [Tachysurus fulvidraco]|uniref:NMDA receptor synaptonuclear signaling and neuronal migration factor isoform X1 n=1 Tax=Tachysurus fulvidraco TaxID=1234273 RepID=UPI001FEF0A0D|nr:NMDA receptor synaptonuclear signaling and neuronal migration factor isoform X1 [Tachysurus fulvidraco]